MRIRSAVTVYLTAVTVTVISIIIDITIITDLIGIAHAEWTPRALRCC